MTNSTATPPATEAEVATLIAEHRRLAAAIAEGLPGLPVRLRCTRGIELAWDDIVRGPISFQSDEIGDIIIQRSNGSQLDFFLCKSAQACHLSVETFDINRNPHHASLFRFCRSCKHSR